MIEIVRLQRTDPVAWALMPHALARVMAFCREIETETDPLEAAELLCRWFAQGDPRLGVWVAADGGHLVGHLWAVPEPAEMETWRYLLLRQAAVDPGVSMHRQSRQAFEAACAWGRSLGLSRVVVATHRNPKAMARAWGLTPHKHILQKSLAPSSGADPSSDGRGPRWGEMPAPVRSA